MEEEEKLLVTLTQLRDRLRKDEEERKEREANEEETLKQKKKKKGKKSEGKDGSSTIAPHTTRKAAYSSLILDK